MNACIFANGSICQKKLMSSDSCKSISCDLIIAADGGVRHCLDMGIKPHLIVGDMDSIDSQADGVTCEIERIKFSKEKDKTDTECAIDVAFGRECSQITILGGVGGNRIDHTLGNIALLAKYSGKIVLATEDGLLIGLTSNQKCCIDGPVGALVSIIAWGTEAKVLTSGLKYELNSETIKTGSSGISNEILKTPAMLYVISGTVIAFFEKCIPIYLNKNSQKIQVGESIY